MYRSLAPEEKLEVDKDNTYCDALAWALEDETIKNIAVTGIYGAGKTSILEKFKRSYSSEYKFFNVSLATFNDAFERPCDEQCSKCSSKRRNNIQNIEECILQQIFYQIDSKKIPRSRFKKITCLSERDLIYFESFFYLLLYLGLNIFYPNFTVYLSYLIENIKHTHLFQLLSSLPSWVINILAKLFLIVFVILTVYVIHCALYYFIQNIHLKKFSVNNVELETDNSEDNNGKSVFNKYMDEIIYFFESTDYDVFIFEDLDRFENTEIFIKLRELNTVVNNYENIHRHIVFIYAIKDDMFKTDEERTKFFDFIVPIIPFLNSSNSSEILNKLITDMKNEALNVNISQQYILDICPFLNDMRLLKNITNEFELYKRKLIKQNINDEKLLSMVIYKNMCSQDFSLLQKNDGFVYLTLENKNKLIKNSIKNFDEKITVLKDERKKLKLSVSTSINDLEYQLTGLLLSKIDDYVSPKLFEIYYEDKGNKKQLTINEYLSSESVIYKSEYIKKIRYMYMNHTDSYAHISNIELDDEVKDFIDSIDIKKSKLNCYNDREINSIDKKIIELENKKLNLKTKSYVELLEIIDASYDEKYSDSQYNIAKFMLRRGYIDETFSNYISYFHEGSLSIDEYNFILSVKNNETNDFTYKLNHINLIISQMNVRDFAGTKFYNFHLVKYMLENINSNDESHFRDCVNMAFGTLCKDIDENKFFLNQFIVYLNKSLTSEQYKNLFGILCEVMCTKSKNACFILQSSCENLERNYKEILLHEILHRLNIQELERQNDSNILVDMILSFNNFVDIVDDIPNIKEIISHFKIYFRDLKINEKNNLVEYIFKEGYFIFNENFMQNINKFYFENNADFFAKNFSFIKSRNCEWLMNKISENMNDYLKYLSEMNNDLYDEKEDVIELLRVNNSDIEIKKKLIRKEKTNFLYLREIDANLWEEIIDEDKIIPTWRNIEIFILQRRLNEKIKAYIIRHINELANLRIHSKKLANLLINNQQISIPLLNGIAFDKMKFKYTNINISNDKICEILIKKDLFQHTVENFNALSDDKLDLLPDFLQNAYDDAQFDIKNCNFDSRNVKVIFNSNISSNVKKQIIHSIGDLSRFSSMCINSIIDFVSQSCTYQEFDFKCMKSIIDRLDVRRFIKLIIAMDSGLSTENLKVLIYLNRNFSDLLDSEEECKYLKNPDIYKFLKVLEKRNIINYFEVQNNMLVAYPLFKYRNEYDVMKIK